MPPKTGPITGPITTVMPKIEVTSPCCRWGKASSTMAFDSGTTGAPMPPCRIRQSTRVSSDSAGPHSKVATVKPMTDQSVPRRPKRAASKPVIGVAIAVARMLKVVVQAISSGVADMLPCICGSRVEATSRVVA